MINRLSEQRLFDIALLQTSILILSLTSIAAKKASSYDIGSTKFITYFILELLIFVVYAILWQQVLKRFDLSIAFASKGTLVIWVFLWAVFLFNEKITVGNLLGALLVIAGILVVHRNA